MRAPSPDNVIAWAFTLLVTVFMAVLAVMLIKLVVP